MPTLPIPPFHPHPLIPGGHVQTLAGLYLPGPPTPYTAVRHIIDLPDGDQLVVHDDVPCRWRDGAGTCLLVHGLGGSHQSGYMQRIAAKLADRGVRAFRLDLRGFGESRYLAIRPTHCGRWADAAAALEFVARQAPHSPTALVGFSLGGAISLNLAAELGSGTSGNLAGVVAVCPPIDLHSVKRHFATPGGRLYDRQFASLLWRQTLRRQRHRPDMPPVHAASPPRRLRDFDGLVTAPRSGFASVDDYYTQASPGPRLIDIRIPTLILAAADDPIVPGEPLTESAHSDAVQVVLTRHGGHLGYIGRARTDPDHRWMDWRVVAWVRHATAPDYTSYDVAH